jgi:hypothetical protein
LHSRYLVDVCIPVYKEKGYLERTLKALTHQTLYQQGRVHIIIGEYKPPGEHISHYVGSLCTQYKDVDYVKIPKRGIGFARGHMVDKASLSDIIMCFDSDSVFNRYDAIEIMINPILRGQALLTNCQSISWDFDRNRKSKFDIDIYKLYDITAALSELLLFSRGQGLTVSKHAYYGVGGFEDVHQMEDTFLSWNVVCKYGLFAKKFINAVKILTSDRRARGFEKIGKKAFDYKENYFR